MKYLGQKISHIQEKKGSIHPAFAYLAVFMLIASIFGLRDVILTPILVSLLEIEGLARWLTTVYWVGLILSTGFLGLYLLQNPLRFQFSANLMDVGLWLLLASPFLYLTITRRLILDFWLDEMMSIVRHIQPSVRNAVFWYPIPNNHVFANLISGIYLQLIGLREMHTILENPIILRLPFFVSGVLTILVLAYLTHTYFGKWAGRIAVVLLCTTIPYLNFVVQVRGYSFSLLFASLMILLFLQYKDNPARWKAFGFAGLSCLMFYTIPSNLFFLLAILGFLSVVAIIQWRKDSSYQISLDREHFILFSPTLTLILMIVGGVLLSLLFYLPIFEQVFDNQYVVSEGFLKGTVFIDAFPSTIKYFLSGRFWIFLVAWFAVLLGWFKAVRERNERYMSLVHLSFFVFMLPFVISFIRGDNPFERTFLVVLPAYILVAVLGLHSLLQWIQQVFVTHKWVTPMLFTIFYFSTNGIFLATYQKIANEIYTNLEEQKIDRIEFYDNRLWASHFLDHYQVLPILEAVRGPNKTLPVLLDDDDTRYDWVITMYFEAYRYPLQLFQGPEQISVPEAYLIVSYPDRSLKDIMIQYPDTVCHSVTQELSVYRVLRCRFLPAKNTW